MDCGRAVGHPSGHGPIGSLDHRNEEHTVVLLLSPLRAVFSKMEYHPHLVAIRRRPVLRRDGHGEQIFHRHSACGSGAVPLVAEPTLEMERSGSAPAVCTYFDSRERMDNFGTKISF